METKSTPRDCALCGDAAVDIESYGEAYAHFGFRCSNLDCAGCGAYSESAGAWNALNAAIEAKVLAAREEKLAATPIEFEVLSSGIRDKIIASAVAEAAAPLVAMIQELWDDGDVPMPDNRAGRISRLLAPYTQPTEGKNNE